MTAYLSYTFNDTPAFVETFDEAPLWSAAFGLLLFRHLQLAPNLTVLDIGSGAGFPLMELAARLGNSSRCFGLDPWTNANARARIKKENYGLTNVEMIEGSADKIPLEDASVDLIVSNLGINNFDQPGLVFRECNRVLKKGGRLALTTNLNGHWKTFYDTFQQTLSALHREEIIEKLIAHQEHRGTPESISRLFTGNGYTVTKLAEDNLDMTFADGSAFLNHYFVKLGWLLSWKALVPDKDQVKVFGLLEQKLNELARAAGQLKLHVPMLYAEGTKL